MRRFGSLLRLSALVCLATLSPSCAQTLGSGERGVARIVGVVRGTPADVHAPVSDRSGNVYILAGSKTRIGDVTAFVGRAGGGFTSGCRVTKGDQRGALGWVGFALDRRWYWAGDALVEVSANGDCRRVLDRDPSTGADLAFRGVLPWVADRPSRTTLVALVQSPTDLVPYAVVVDLDAHVYTVPRVFDPDSAREVVVHGVGASAARREGYAIVSFKSGDARVTEARFFDETGATTARVHVDADLKGPMSLRGFVQANANGLVAGLTEDKRLLLFDRSGARIVDAPLDATGVHVWNDALYVVGLADNRPTIAPIADTGAVLAPRLWDTSAVVTRDISRPMDVTDDRAPPRRSIRYSTPRPVGGPFALVTEDTSAPYARDTTLVLIGGPTWGEGADAFTEVAIAPVGVSYP